MRIICILFLAFFELFITVSCKSPNPGNCDLPVNDLTITKIIDRIIVEDTLTISEDLYDMVSKNDNIKKNRIGSPKLDTYLNLQLEKLRFGNDSLGFITIKKLYPYLSREDSLFIRCQMNSDSSSKWIKRNFLSFKEINEIDNEYFISLSKENRYRIYPAFYTFSKPFFFNDNKLCFVDVRWHCGVDCGDFWLILLAYRNGEWNIYDRLHYGGL